MGKKSRVKARFLVTTETERAPEPPKAEKPAITKATLRTPLEELRILYLRRQKLDRSIADKVGELQRAGYSWGLIGEQLNMTRQGARQRFGGDRTSQNDQL